MGLTWEELKGDKIKDESEWHDVDFTWTKTHPDWGLDENARQYFRDAAKRPKYKEFKLDDDTSKYET